VGGSEAKWDKIYANRENNSFDVDESLLAIGHLFPSHGKALDLAGGTGRNALWLCKLGFSTTLLDVSTEALNIAETEATARGLKLQLLKTDLEKKPPPIGPWDLITIVNYCQTPLYKNVGELLRPGGVIAVVQATTKNLERHKSPSSRFLLKNNELEKLFGGLTVLHNESGWRDNGRHEITFVAQRNSEGHV
jgi:tellurite methyltransferase